MREQIEKILRGEAMSLTTIDLDGVILIHKFTCQRCDRTEEFTDDQLQEIEKSQLWRQFGFAPIGLTFRPGAICGECVRSLVKWWGVVEGSGEPVEPWRAVHDHVGDEDFETTIPIDREEIMK